MKGRKVALVTGASRGIGSAIAAALAEAGADLCLCARRPEALEEVARVLAPKTRVLALQADVSRAGDVQALVGQCRRELGPVDWLVNNAGVVEIAPLAELTEEQWDHTIDVNLKGVFLCTQAALPDLQARRGRVVNIGSISGTLGTPRMSPYNASKWGVNGLTLSWAEELKAAGVFVAAVLPGSVDTDMLRKSGFPPEMQPEDIARIVRFLLTEAPFAMTGSLVNAFG
jgi:NAD(P)-dependent dehydrogenase (short-subunit alcohol dehydrogenase family)